MKQYMSLLIFASFISLNIEPAEQDKKDILTELYQYRESSLLDIPLERLYKPNGEPINLKDLFESKGIQPGWRNEIWTDKQWNDTLVRLIKRQENKKNGVFVSPGKSLDQVLALLEEAKKIAKSVLGPDISDTQRAQLFKKTGGLDRIFTYVKLGQVIKEKNLTHVRLPLKYIYIKDKTTGTYLPKKEALKIIDDKLKVGVITFIKYNIGLASDRYEIEVFATRQKSEETGGFSQATMNELLILCKEAPFDIGYDNIFWDAKGDAIIIDTEYKNSSEDDCEKLNRYPVVK